MTHIRTGNCKVAEFNAPTLSGLLEKMARFAKELESHNLGRYSVTYVSQEFSDVDETHWWAGSIFYDYFLEAWQAEAQVSESLEMMKEVLGG